MQVKNGLSAGGKNDHFLQENSIGYRREPKLDVDIHIHGSILAVNRMNLSNWLGVVPFRENAPATAPRSRSVRIANHRIVVQSILLVALGCAAAVCGEPPAKGGNDEASPEVKRVGLETARDRARLLHEVYVSTLDVVHRYYFDANRSVLPARSMEDVFADVKSQTRVEARWISVNTPAMSVHHEPRTDFEKQAAEAIAGGKPDFEQVDKGYYLRAGAVPLASGCVNCHMGFSRSAGEKARFAGLVIRIPIQEGKP